MKVKVCGSNTAMPGGCVIDPGHLEAEAREIAHKFAVAR
jgi:hypothetical protein